jgi:hypothetical protein
MQSELKDVLLRNNNLHKETLLEEQSALVVKAIFDLAVCLYMETPRHPTTGKDFPSATPHYIVELALRTDRNLLHYTKYAAAAMPVQSQTQSQSQSQSQTFVYNPSLEAFFKDYKQLPTPEGIAAFEMPDLTDEMDQNHGSIGMLYYATFRSMLHSLLVEGPNNYEAAIREKQTALKIQAFVEQTLSEKATIDVAAQMDIDTDDDTIEARAIAAAKKENEKLCKQIAGMQRTLNQLAKNGAGGASSSASRNKKTEQATKKKKKQKNPKRSNTQRSGSDRAAGDRDNDSTRNNRNSQQSNGNKKKNASKKNSKRSRRA